MHKAVALLFSLPLTILAATGDELADPQPTQPARPLEAPYVPTPYSDVPQLPVPRPQPVLVPFTPVPLAPPPTMTILPPGSPPQVAIPIADPLPKGGSFPASGAQRGR